jgi:hypothetical protein
MMVVKVLRSGDDGRPKRTVRITNVDGGGVERADAHGLRIRRLY